MTPEDLKHALRQLAAEAAEFKDATGSALTEVIADWLTPQYAVAAREQLANAANPDERWKVLRLVTGDLSALRRGDHCAERLRLERERLNLLREQCEKAKEAEYEEWLKRPEIRERMNPKQRKDQVRKRVMEILDHHLLGTPLPEFEYLDEEAPLEPGENGAMI